MLTSVWTMYLFPVQNTDPVHTYAHTYVCVHRPSAHVRTYVTAASSGFKNHLIWSQYWCPAPQFTRGCRFHNSSVEEAYTAGLISATTVHVQQCMCKVTRSKIPAIAVHVGISELITTLKAAGQDLKAVFGTFKCFEKKNSVQAYAGFGLSPMDKIRNSPVGIYIYIDLCSQVI